MAFTDEELLDNILADKALLDSVISDNELLDDVLSERMGGDGTKYTREENNVPINDRFSFLGYTSKIAETYGRIPQPIRAVTEASFYPLNPINRLIQKRVREPILEAIPERVKTGLGALHPFGAVAGLIDSISDADAQKKFGEIFTEQALFQITDPLIATGMITGGLKAVANLTKKKLLDMSLKLFGRKTGKTINIPKEAVQQAAERGTIKGEFERLQKVRKLEPTEVKPVKPDLIETKTAFKDHIEVITKEPAMIKPEGGKLVPKVTPEAPIVPKPTIEPPTAILGVSGKPLPSKIGKFIGKEPIPNIETKEDVLLRNKLKAEVRGAKVGFKEGTRVTKEELTTKFNQNMVEVAGLKKHLIEQINSSLPPSERGKWLAGLSREITQKKATQLERRISEQAERVELRTTQAEIRGFSVSHSVVAEYRRKITELKQAFDPKNRGPKTEAQLKSLDEFIQRNPDMLLQHPQLVSKLSRLSRRPLNSLNLQESKELADSLRQLEYIGKTKARLTNLHNKRAFEKDRNKLIASSRDYDPKILLSKKNPEKNFTIKTAYTNLMSPVRWANAIDGYRRNKGENAKMVKYFATAEINYTDLGKARGFRAIEDITKIVNDMDWSDDILTSKVMAQIRMREKRYDVAQKHLDQFDLGKLSDYQIDPRLEQVVDVVKSIFNEKVLEMQALWEMSRKEPFFIDPDYVMPLKYEKEISQQGISLLHSYNRTARTSYGGGIERKKNVDKIPRHDLFDMIIESLKEQEYFLGIEPIILNTRPLILSPEYKEKAGILAAKSWTEYLDIMANRGNLSAGEDKMLFSGLKTFRGNLSKALLGYRATSAFIQPTAILDTIAYGVHAFENQRVIYESLKELMKTNIAPGYAKKIVSASKGLQVRQGGEVGIAELSGEGAISQQDTLDWKKWFSDPLGFLKNMDMRTAAASQSAVEKINIRNNVPDAKEEADIFMNLSQGSSLVSLRPMVLSRGELGKTFLHLQTFVLNRFGIMMDLINEGVIRGDTVGRKLRAIEALAILGIASGIVEESIRRPINAFIKQKEKRDMDVMNLLMFGLVRNIPFFGNILDFALNNYYGGSSSPPMVQTLEKGIKSAGDMWNGRITKGLANLAESGISLWMGIPGTGQFFDIAEGIGKSKTFKKVTKPIRRVGKRLIKPVKRVFKKVKRPIRRTLKEVQDLF